MPPIVMPGIATRSRRAPSTMSSRPGIRKSQRGVHIRKKRSVRQPSRNVFRCGGWLVRPSGCSVIGTSPMRAPTRLALMIISVANSIPVQRWSSSSVERLGEAAHAAVDVVDRRAEPAARHAREHRVAEPAVQARHRAGQHASAARLQPAALHEVVALAQPLDELRHLAEVVAVVGVAHDHEAPARRCDAAHQRGAVAARRRPARRARLRASRSPASRPCCRCRRRRPRRRCRLRPSPSAPCGCRSPACPPR